MKNTLNFSIYYLKLLKDNDVDLFNEIQAMDEKKLCFGDAILTKDCHPYLNFAIVDGENHQLAGYLGLCQVDEKFLADWLLTIVIAPNYRHKGLADFIIKKTLNTLFSYPYIRRLYVTIEEKNKNSVRLFERNEFINFCGFAGYDFMKINGKRHYLKHYLYTKEMYQEKKQDLVAYQKLLIKQ